MTIPKPSQIVKVASCNHDNTLSVSYQNHSNTIANTGNLSVVANSNFSNDSTIVANDSNCYNTVRQCNTDSVRNTVGFLNPESFRQAIAKEFINGSGIAENLFNSSVSFHRDLETDISGNVETPIHDALGWRVVRFGYQVKQNLFAAFINQEAGDLWQAKLSNQRVNKENGKLVKYETPKGNGNGSRAFLPTIPLEIRLAIGARYGVIVPIEGSFWDWLELHPEIDIVITEGAKKSLCLLSNGFVAIAVSGVNSGYRTTQHGVPLPAPVLIPDLQRFANGRKIVLAFDRDSNPQTIRKVNAAIWKTAKLFETANEIAKLCEIGGDVAIARWDNANGRDKGVDDLVVNQGLEAWTKAYDNARSLRQWQIQDRYNRRLVKYKPTLTVNVSDLSTAIAPENFPQQGIIAIISDYGTGKTKLLKELTQGNKIIKLGHRVSLERNAAKVINLSFLNDLDRVSGRYFNKKEQRFLTEAENSRVALCFESIMKIEAGQLHQGDLILDECDQGLRTALTSATCSKNGIRPVILRRLEELIRAAKRIILLSADLGDREIDYICRLRGEDPAMVLLNKYQRPRGNCRFLSSTNDSAIIAEILEKTKSGQKLLILTDTLTRGRAIARLLTPILGKESIFEFNRKTSGSPQGLEFSTDPDQFLINNPHIKTAIISPSGFTGLSITHNHFDEVYGLFSGGSVVTDDCMQSLERIRLAIPRTVWAAKNGKLFSKAGQETNSLQIKGNLKESTDVTAELLRAELNPEQLDTLKHYKWKDNPHLDLFAEYEADRNFSMWNFRDCLQVRLEMTGYEVETIEIDNDFDAKDAIKEAIAEITLEDAIATANARNLTKVEALALEAKETLTIDEQFDLDKFYVSQFYVIPVENVTTDDALFNRKGRTKRALQRLEYMTFPELAKSADVRAVNECTPKDHTATIWDLGKSELQRQVLDFIGFYGFVDYALKGNQWSKYTEIVIAIANECRENSRNIKKVLGFNPTKMADCAIIAALLNFVGLKNPERGAFKLVRVRVRIGCSLAYFYNLDFEYVEKVRAILKRRFERLSKTESVGVLHPVFKEFIEGIEQLKNSHKSEQNAPPKD
jgi:hypothetical protein